MSKPLVLLLGGDSLVGRDFRDRFSDTGVAARLELTAAGEGVSAVIAATSSDEDDDPEVIPALDEEQIAAAKVIVFAGQPEEARAGYELIQKYQGLVAVVDLTGELEGTAEVRVRAPFLESVPPTNEFVHIVPHPAAYMLAHFLTQLNEAQPLKRAVATVFEPASASGRKAIGELQKQAISLLTFKPVPKDVFGEQLAFNLLARPSEESTIGWAGREKRIERHLASLLAIDGKVPMPSVRLVQAPVFHGYSISLWVEFASSVKAAAILEHLREEGADIRGEDLDAPNNVGMSGESGYAIGAVEVDRNDSRACWFWLAGDNHRIAADVAVDVVTELV